jgi:hypothetical protein
LLQADNRYQLGAGCRFDVARVKHDKLDGQIELLTARAAAAKK